MNLEIAELNKNVRDLLVDAKAIKRLLQELINIARSKEENE